jgi:hypothetical protein
MEAAKHNPAPPRNREQARIQGDARALYKRAQHKYAQYKRAWSANGHGLQQATLPGDQCACRKQPFIVRLPIDRIGVSATKERR